MICSSLARESSGPGSAAAAAVVGAFLLVTAATGCRAPEDPLGTWASYLGDDARTHYSSLKQIHRGNVGRLEVAWTYQSGDLRENDLSQIQTNPIIVDTVLYGVSPGLSAFAIHAATGSEIWTFRPSEHYDSPGETSGVLRGVAYWSGGRERRILFTAGPYLYAFDARTGWAVWRYRTSGPIISSPALANGVVFIGSADKHLYALDARNGRILWKYETEGQVTSSPAYANGAVYFGGIDNYVYSVDAETGELRWRFKTGGPVPSSPEVRDDIVYIGSTDRYVYAIPA